MESYYYVYRRYYESGNLEIVGRTKKYGSARFHCERLNNERTEQEQSLFHFIALRKAADMPVPEELSE